MSEKTPGYFGTVLRFCQLLLKKFRRYMQTSTVQPVIGLDVANILSSPPTSPSSEQAGHHMSASPLSTSIGVVRSMH